MRITILSFVLLLFSSCSKGPVAIHYSKDDCDFCKMTIMDNRFSCQCQSTKGKNFKFDDAFCMISFLKNDGNWKNEVEGIYFSDFSGNDQWITSDNSFLLKSDKLKSPMGGNVAAFSRDEARDSVFNIIGGEKTDWNKIKQ